MDLIHASYVDPDDRDDLEAERAYERAEREGLRIDSLPCAFCPDPGLCQAEAECVWAAE